MSNTALQVATAALLTAHFVALLLAAFVNRSPVPLLLLNLCTAVGVMIYFAFHPQFLTAPVDEQMLALSAAEAVICVISTLGLRGVRMAIIASYAIFSVHFLIAGAATAFAFLFRITRLF
jgi:hypothetical protein